jgi:hypothetical protein
MENRLIDALNAIKNMVVRKKEKPTGLCPCSGECCKNPKTFCPRHVCVEDICESCFVSECKSCGSSCCCDL